MESEQNEFTRKSKKYRTKYLDEIGKLYGMVHDVENAFLQDEVMKVNPRIAGQDKKRV